MSLRQTFAILLLAAGLLGPSCGSNGDSESVPSCEEVGAHMSKICGTPVVGADVRSDCQVFGLDPKVRRCLIGITDCSFDAANRGCGLVDVMVTCTTTAECPAPLLCAPAKGWCTECVTAAECGSGMSCPAGGGGCFPSIPDGGT